LCLDWADGEFSRMKDALLLHLHRSMEAENYKEVVDSATFCDFGRTNLVKPGPRSGMEKRTFHDLKTETIKERSEEVSI
jgi:hypothetical protein